VGTLVRIWRGRARRGGSQLAGLWAIGLGLLTIGCGAGLVTLGRGALLWLAIPALATLVASLAITALAGPRYPDGIPIRDEAELRHLVQHAKLAHQLGIAKKDIAVVENGYPLTFDGDRMRIGKRVPGDHVFVDGSLVGEVGPLVMRQRDRLAQSGFVTAVAPYDRKAGKTVGQPRIITRGFVYAPNAEHLLTQAGELVRSTAAANRGKAPGRVEEKVERALSGLFLDRLNLVLGFGNVDLNAHVQRSRLLSCPFQEIARGQKRGRGCQDGIGEWPIRRGTVPAPNPLHRIPAQQRLLPLQSRRQPLIR